MQFIDSIKWRQRCVFRTAAEAGAHPRAVVEPVPVEPNPVAVQERGVKDMLQVPVPNAWVIPVIRCCADLKRAVVVWVVDAARIVKARRQVVLADGAVARS